MPEKTNSRPFTYRYYDESGKMTKAWYYKTREEAEYVGKSDVKRERGGTFTITEEQERFPRLPAYEDILKEEAKKIKEKTA